MPALVVGLINGLSPHFVRITIGLLRKHQALDDITKTAVMRAVNNDAACYQVCEFLSRVQASAPATAPSGLALGLECALSASQSDERKQHIDVVWTGPNTNEPLRKSAAVLLQMIQSAQQEIIVLSFAAFRIPDALSAFKERARKGVRIYFILESNEGSKGRLHTDAADAFQTLSQYPNVAFLTWPLEKRPPGALLHAKAVIVDRNAALITSANLTENAISSNIEIGTLIRGGEAPGRIHDHITALIRSGEFQEL